MYSIDRCGRKIVASLRGKKPRTAYEGEVFGSISC